MALLCVALTTACGDGAGDRNGGRADEAPASIDGPLGDALALAPPQTTDLHFTHWDALSDDPEDLLAALQGTNDALARNLDRRGLFPLVSFDSYFYPEFEKLWGWNTDDLAWESAFYVEELDSAVHVLRFRDPLDRGELERRLRGRGFSETDERGIAVYVRGEALDPKNRDAPWFMNAFGPRTPLQVLNMAIVDDSTLLLASDPEPLEEAVSSVAAGESAGEAFTGALAAVAGSPRVMAFSADDLCTMHERGNATGTEEGFERAEALEGREYQSLAIGFGGVDQEPRATVVVHHAGEAGAEAGLELREAAARGPSIATGRAYEDVYGKLEQASVEGRDILLEFSTARGGGFGFGDALRSGDMPFAAC